MTYPSLKNKVALITGAGEGIGYAVAKMLLESGGKVVLNDLSETVAKNSAATLEAGHVGNCKPFAGDAGSIEDIDAMLAFVIKEYGRLDFAIANAGITVFGDFFDFSPEDFRKTIKVNLEGSFFLTQRAAKIMKDQGRGGRVIVMSSVTGITSIANLSAYSMTKAALQMMVRNLVQALAPHKITINAIAPGATLTNRTRAEEPDYAGTWGSLTPMGRVGTPEDIANTCLFLLSDKAAHITGQTIVIDGGWTTVGRGPEDVGN